MNTPVFIAFDTETERTSYQNPVPDLVCLTHADAGENRGTIVTPVETDVKALVLGWLEKGYHVIGHNIAFDMSVLAFKYPDMLPDIFRAYNAGQVHDTMIREKLLNITLHGSLDSIEANGTTIQVRYALKDLEKKYLGIDRSDLKDDEDSPRLNYAIYKDVPLQKWAPEFVSYAIDDAIDTGLVFQAQEVERQRCIDVTGYDPFLPALESFRTRTAFSLRLIECTGSLLDGNRVLEVTKQFEEEYNQPRLRDPLIAAGLLIPEQPPQPHANGAIDHLSTCPGHKDHPDYKKGRKFKGADKCACPPKMRAGEPEHSPQKPLFQFIWNLAAKNPDIKAWPSDGCVKTLKAEGVYEKFVVKGCFTKEVILSTNIEDEIKRLRAKLKRLQTEPVKTFEINTRIDKIKDEIAYLTRRKEDGWVVLFPDDMTLCVDAEWTETFAPLDPLLSIWEERKATRKIVTDYLPKMYYTDPATGVMAPAAIIRGAFNPMVKSGRCSSFTSKLYPSRNEQNVDPRVRPCTIPRPGNVIISTDYSGMELGTLAQKCIQLFGHSELGAKINAGIDTHAFLAAQIAFAMDEQFASAVRSCGVPLTTDGIFSVFKEAKGVKEPCETELSDFAAVFRRNHPDDFIKTPDKKVTWANFFKHYRTLAKPTGLGYPGGLGAATFISYAKATFSLRLDLETAKKLKQIWLETFPEMVEYLAYAPKHLVDINHPGEEYEDEDGNLVTDTWYAYDTPRGMHRAKCSFCECANGMGLQSFSAEGALEALNRVTEAMWLAGTDKDLSRGNDPFDRCYLIGFIHDEILWESPDDEFITERAKEVERIMVEAMQELTPDVKAGASSVAMRRWYKEAEGKYDENGKMIIWEPEAGKV